MTDFADLAAQAPKHDPASCRREPCGKCRPSGAPNPPKPVDHNARPAQPPRILAVDQLHGMLTTTTRDLEHLGVQTWRAFADWTSSPQHARDTLRGGGLASPDGDGRSDDRIENARLDRQAAAYHDELDRLTRRLDVDLQRLRILLRIANPDRPSSLRPGELTNAQLIADGWCPSCFRNHQHLNPLAQGRYSDRCRTCGDFRGRAGRDPNLDELRLMHSRGKSLRQRIAG